MQRLLGSLLVLVVLAALLPAATALPGAAVSSVQAQSTLDDELVILQSDGRIVVHDPYTPAGYRPVEWQSPGGAWADVATGDFNGDGDAEIIALRGEEARVFDPVVPAGAPAVSFSVTVAGETWKQVATGDIDNDGRDEIILIRTTSESGQVQRMQAYDGDETGTSWTLIPDSNNAYGKEWIALATGDVNNDGSDEIAAVRSADKRLTIWNPSGGWNLLHDSTYGYKWLTVEIADTHDDGSGKDEILVTRQGVLGVLDSFLIFRWSSGTSLADVAGGKFYPYFHDIAAGDINASGDDEVFLLRETEGSSDALVMRNYGDDPAIEFETLRGESKWKRIQTGDTDADGRAELIVMAQDEYRIYTQPHANESFTPVTGSFASSGNFAVGNLDGQGIPQGPQLSVSPTNITLSLEGGQSTSQNVSITNVGDSSVINWTASVTSGESWLSVDQASGSTPATLQLLIDALGLAAGSYTGKVRVDGGSGVFDSPQDITVNLTVTTPAVPILTVSPTNIDLALEWGQNSVQTVDITNTGNASTINWTASVVTGASWLSLVQSSGTTPGTLQIQIDTASLDVGDHAGVIRVDGGAGVTNSPQDITVNLTVTAPPFGALPGELQWFHQLGTDSGMQTVNVFGSGIYWHAGVVPMSAVQSVLEAVEAGAVVRRSGNRLVIADGAEPQDVPVVDWVDITPSSGTAAADGAPVLISLVTGSVPRGFNRVAVVFVADQQADPRAAVVDLAVVGYQDGSDLTFIPAVAAR